MAQNSFAGMFAAPRSNSLGRLADLYFNTPMPPRSQGDLRAYHPTLGEKAETGLANVLGRLGVGTRQANRLAGKTLGALTALTPVGGALGAYEAGRDIGQGNYLAGGLGAALSVLPIPGPKAGKSGGELRAILPHNDTGDGLDTIRSLTDFLSDPRPIHQMYDVGDVLVHRGEVGPVVSATKDAVVLDLPSGQRIVPRRDPNLEVAPYRQW